MADTYTASKTILIDAKQTKIIAHRGLSGIECENTIAAFIAAGNRNYFGIEADVHITADLEFIIIHDDDTNRVSNTKMPVEGSSYEQLRSIVLNDKDGSQRIDLHLPSLSEYLKTCKRYEKKAVLEIKNRMPQSQIERILNIVKDEYSIEDVIFISFDFENLVDIRKIHSDANIQYLCDKADDITIEELKKYNFDIDIWEGFLTQDLIQKLHDNGILVNCWTCDNKNRAEQLINWNVDFITTNILQAKS